MACSPIAPDAVAGYLSGADEGRYQIAVDSSSPYTAYGNITPLKRPSPSPPVAVDQRLFSGGFRVLQLPIGADNPEPPAEAFYHGRQEDLSPRSCGAAQKLPPAFPSRPLARSTSDPVPLSQLQNPLSAPSYVAGSRTDPNSPSGSFGNVSAQEFPSPKRLRRQDQMERIRAMKQLVDEMVKGEEQDDGLTNVSTEKAIVEVEEEAEEDVVSAKKDGDTTHLKFKCNCGSGFDVVLIRQCCYYKLI